ncbi:NAD(P)H-hydrate dehydratase [Algoriphagus kandeliae]|uniref:Bifunctional NAD(P)H-hydrate repair enzyme n=1 Tax=Algoriphagus kandeliae TaxID=2562278 RepID=A0A4Y9QLT6_9BACT|nr:NAD(P)H-hydrate dehydratase [Algoriphagus kandeliae]TFV93210.1 NAD(P)H-hydrate dehydratase [Algoriphagus kandeliae]
MIRILQGESVKKLDQLHVERSGESGYDLMERAARGFCNWFLVKGFERAKDVFVYAGAGNNGGDGLAIARLLSEKGWKVNVIACFDENSSLSPDAETNLEKLPKEVSLINWKVFSTSKDGIFIDSYLGVGLKGDLRDEARDLIQKFNSFSGIKIAVDIPSGLQAEGVGSLDVVKADYTITFAFPKLALLLPENASFVGELEVVDIGINESLYQEFDSDYFFIQQKDVLPLHRKFNRFSHKGDFGKILLVGGSPGKMGAMIMASKSALRTGAGLVSAHIEESEREIIQTAVPEAMASWGLVANPEYYDAIGIGPGWGIEQRKLLLESLFKNFQKPMVLDADALNVLARNPELLEKIPSNSILTPHIGEFERLVGRAENHLDRIKQAKEFSQKYRIILVLKGANTLISLPDGRQLFNSSGSPFMATGGSGDALTGMLTAYLGMGYSPENAAICGVFHHGLAGQLAGELNKRGTIATDIIEKIPETYRVLGIE